MIDRCEDTTCKYYDDSEHRNCLKFKMIELCTRLMNKDISRTVDKRLEICVLEDKTKDLLRNVVPLILTTNIPLDCPVNVSLNECAVKSNCNVCWIEWLTSRLQLKGVKIK